MGICLGKGIRVGRVRIEKFLKKIQEVNFIIDNQEKTLNRQNYNKINNVNNANSKNESYDIETNTKRKCSDKVIIYNKKKVFRINQEKLEEKKIQKKEIKKSQNLEEDSKINLEIKNCHILEKKKEEEEKSCDLESKNNEKQNKEIKEKYINLEEKNNDLEKEKYNNLLIKYKDLEKEKEEINEKYIDLEKKNREIIDNLRKENEEFKKSSLLFEEIKQQNLILQKDNEDVKKNILNLRNENKDLKEKEIQLQKNNEDLQNQNKELVEKEYLLQNNISDLKNQNQEITNKNISLENDNKKIYDEYLLLKKTPILVGLNNIGATCYMNATLQCLSNTDDLTNFFLDKFKDDLTDKNKIISNAYYNVIKSLWDRENNNKSFSPNEFKEK